MRFLTPEEQYALALSTFAGLSTSLGAAAAVIKRPDDALLALLLGIAIGVMFLLSFVELWLNNALEHGVADISFAVLLGALTYQLVQPFIPDFNPDYLKASPSDTSLEKAAGGEGPGDAAQLPLKAPTSMDRTAALGRKGAARRGGEPGVPPPVTAANGPEDRTNGSGDDSVALQRTGSGGRGLPPASPPVRVRTPTARESKLRSGELLRLGMLMAVTMTLHNMPEGFAVAFAAFTKLGPIMALAIATHNIAEGVIVAAPVYAATGSRLKALGIATASGLSEPLGGLIALVAVRPYLSEGWLQVMLGFVGGIMMAVCVLELWPEGRKCGHDRRLLNGIGLGAAVMGWTLWAGA